MAFEPTSFGFISSAVGGFLVLVIALLLIVVFCLLRWMCKRLRALEDKLEMGDIDTHRKADQQSGPNGTDNPSYTGEISDSKAEGSKHGDGEATNSLDHSYSYVTHSTHDTEQSSDQEYSTIALQHSSRLAAHPGRTPKQDSHEGETLPKGEQRAEPVSYTEPFRHVPYPSPKDSETQKVNKSPTRAMESQKNDHEPYSVLQHKGVRPSAFKKKRGLFSQPTAANYRYSYPGPDTSVDSGKTRQSMHCDINRPLENPTLPQPPHSPHPLSLNLTHRPPAPSQPPPPPPTEHQYGVLEAPPSPHPPPVPPQTSETAILVPESIETLFEKWSMPELTEVLYDDAQSKSKGAAEEPMSRKDQLQSASGKEKEVPPTRERSSLVLSSQAVMYEDVALKSRTESCNEPMSHRSAETGFSANSLNVYESVQ